MYIETISSLSGAKRDCWERFIVGADLNPDEAAERTVLVWENDALVASGARYKNILKLIAVDPAHRGEDLTSTVVSALRTDAFSAGHRHLFLYTKPQNETAFSSLFFYPIAKTDKVVLLEDRKGGITRFIDGLPRERAEGRVGAVVMNCNPFTLGHRYLVEHAAKECDRLYVFVLSEDGSTFSPEDRIEMVRRGTQDLERVCVLPTGPYLISSATFPTYFLKDRDKHTDVQCLLDIEIFTRYFVPHFGITDRYVGSEPLSPLTAAYNKALAEHLPEKGIVLKEIERVKCGDEPISASAVRRLIREGDTKHLSALLPRSTVDYLTEKKYIR